MSHSEQLSRLHALDAQIAQLVKEREALFNELNPHIERERAATAAAELKEFIDNLIKDCNFAEEGSDDVIRFLNVGLKKMPITTDDTRIGKYYDPVWYTSEIKYRWGDMKIVVERATNLNHLTEYTIFKDGKDSWHNSNPLEIHSWSDLEEIEDELKVAAIMLHVATY